MRLRVPPDSDPHTLALQSLSKEKGWKETGRIFHDSPSPIILENRNLSVLTTSVRSCGGIVKPSSRVRIAFGMSEHYSRSRD